MLLVCCWNRQTNEQMERWMDEWLVGWLDKWLFRMLATQAAQLNSRHLSVVVILALTFIY